MRHFNYFENGGPAPSACLSCGNNKQLFDLGRELPITGGMAQVCLTCAKELAAAVGYAPEAPLQDEISTLKAELVSRETELAKIPNHIEELINGVRSSVTDFIFAVSYSDSTDIDSTVSNDDGAKPRSNQGRKVAQRDDSASSELASE